MSLISMKFVVFVAAAVFGYYVIPKRFQWMWLLLFSYIYYASSGVKFLFFLLFSTLTTYGAGRLLYAVRTSCTDKKKVRFYGRIIVVCGLFLNFGMLAVMKYTNFAVLNINAVFGTQIDLFSLLLPLGISFYTFQSTGYVLDVYWGKCEPERNVLRFALFVSFFPQILQGPIGRFHRLAGQLYAEHTFDFQRIERGLELILWGFFKKMVLADNAGVFVSAIFSDTQRYAGLSIFGVLGYSIQLYGDFSGGMDVVQGISNLFGITLDDNFKRPYFARSITDFWHRWHITLGTWMKDYVFYPVSLSGWMNRFGRFAKKRFGKSIGRTLPICVANLIVFLVVGIWHGAAWKFIVYGLYNGIIIAVSGLLAGQYRSWKKALHINGSSWWYQLFQILRTFLLVNISWFFDRADSVPQALGMMHNAVTTFTPSELLSIPVQQNGSTAMTAAVLVILAAGCLVLFCVSVLQERGVCVREALAKRPLVLRLAVYLALFFALPCLGQPPSLTGGFIYAQF